MVTEGPLSSRGSDLPPGPRGPSLVQALGYVRNPLAFLVRQQQRYGDIFTVSLPYFGKVVYVTSPDLVKQVFMGSPAVFHAGEAVATMLEWSLGPSSLFTLDDGPHMQQRKLLLPPFHGDRIRRHGQLIRAATRREMESWPIGEPFSLFPHAERITLSTMLGAVLGIEGEERIGRAAALIDNFSKSVGPIAKFPPLRHNLGRFSPWRRFLKARADLDQYLYEEIALRRDGAAREERDDVLSLLLQARHDDGSPMEDEELRDELVTIIGAGYETTASALAWAMERLLHTPAVLERLEGALAAGETNYLVATVKETLRVRPPVASVARKLTDPVAIAGYDLPKGSFLALGICALHHRKDLFPEPEQFRPERFIDSKIDNYAWIPFGGGTRRCIGSAFAEYEMKIVLQEIIERAHLIPASPSPEAVRVRHVTMAPAQGTRVVLERALT